jgi:hypothetical protein
MKRALRVTALLAMGILVASSFVAAQDAPASNTGGQVTFGFLGRGNVSSSKFTEYREVPKGVSIPYATLFAWNGDKGFTIWADNIRQADQRFTGVASLGWLGVAFDYNQTPHNMGNNARSIYNEVGTGYWGLSAAMRSALGTKADTTLPTSLRTYDFYNTLLAPTFAAAETIDISSMRERGSVTFDIGKQLPFDLKLTYMRERKSGYRGQSSVDIVSAVGSIIDIPEPLSDLTQDFGFRAGYTFKAGNVHAALNRNTYDNQAETLRVDNPFQPVDVAYNNVTASPLGGPGTVRVINAPDNEATTGSFGFLLKFKKQTRLGGDFAMAKWTQNASFYPYTINSTIKTTAGLDASSTNALQVPSLNGKIDTNTVNVWFTSRPVQNLGIRARYRSYDLSNKTPRFLITGDAASSPDRSWSSVTATTDAPYGHATANLYDNTSKRFDLSANYDIKALTLEGSFFTNSLTRTSREAETGKDKGYGLAAVYHLTDVLGVRAFYTSAKRSAEGETVYGFQEDESERDMTKTGVDIEISPSDKFDVTLAYFRRNVDYPDRPNRVQLTNGVPTVGASPIPGTASGLLSSKYDTFSVDLGFRPTARFELDAFYSYEKDAKTNQWATLTGAALNNLLNYAGSDKGNTFGLNGVFQLVPDKWTLTMLASHQKIDGLMDITAREAGAFYTPGRTTSIPAGTGGAADITDWDDTTLTTVGLQLDHHVAKSWTVGVGYAYEKYDFSDAYTSGTSMLPASIYIMMKPDFGGYKVNVCYAKLSYRF